MNRRTGLVQLFSAVLLLSFAVSAGAASTPPGSPLNTIARVMITLNHYPSDQEKQELRAIINSESATVGERTLASSLIDMEHQVTSSDRQKLEDLKEDQTASEIERELADILMNMNHKPSSRDRDRLRQIL